MSRPAIDPKSLRFGLFELDLAARELRKAGVRIKLQDQPFQILALLLERPGEVVTREDLQKRLWPEDTFVDFDLSLNSAIKKLRQTLGDDSENPRFVETLYRRGYRFIAPVSGHVSPEIVAVPAPTLRGLEPVKATAEPRREMFWRTFPWLLLTLLIAVIALLYLWRPVPLSQVIGYTQLTHDDLPKCCIVTDGERLYFQTMKNDQFVVGQVSSNGGETSVLDTPFRNVGIGDIAWDGSALLIASFEGTSKESSVWTMPLPSGSPRRLGDTAAHSGTWSPDQNELVFAKGSDLYVTNTKESQPRKLVTVDGTVFNPRFSPDGHRIRFDVMDPRNGSSALWEMNRDGSGLRPLLPGWNPTPHECCGSWTRNGKYYLFESFREGKSNVWVLPERTRWPFSRPKPAQLTNGPLDFDWAVPSKDGKKIFTVGSQRRGELIRYDGKTGFSPYLRGISATELAFSTDGQWVAYVSIPDRILWRSRLDGSERLRLTDWPLAAGLPKWSPDQKQIVFMGRTLQTNWRAYLVSSDAGAARELIPGAEVGFDPGWSPDGKFIVLTLNEAGSPTNKPEGPGIAIFDLQSRKLSLIPGAEQLFSPRWSPDGKYIAAFTDDSQKLMLLDRSTQKWTEIASMPFGYPSWSHDGQYLYFDTTFTDDPAIFRIRISDRKMERLASLKDIRRLLGEWGEWTGLAPDDSTLLVRDTSSQEIYALDFQAP